MSIPVAALRDGRARAPAKKHPLLDAPTLAFAVLSLLFGAAIVAINPPFRGADEPAHFLRAYAMAGGEILPLADAQGHKGTFLPPLLAADFNYFRDALYLDEPTSYREIMEEYFDTPPDAAESGSDGAPVFVLYEGSEGYSPAAYLPYIPVAALGRVLHLKFLPLLYLMRLSGLLAYTAIAVFAIAAIGILRWPLLLIVMLPANLYARAIVSDDGAAFGFALAAMALCVRAAAQPATARAWPRAVWMALCVLSKPPQIALVLLEAMTGAPRALAGRWRTTALVTLPGVVLLLLWVAVTGTDLGSSWRMIDENHPAEHFAFAWKLGFMLSHPLRFPAMLLGNFTDNPLELWRQVIGVLGWLSDPLHPFVYWTLSVALALVLFDRLDLPKSVRMRLALVSIAVAILYVLAVSLILFLAWSRVDVAHIDGLQGRYLEICLPLLALALSAGFDWRPTGAALAPVALAGAVVSGAGTIEAILRNCWLIASSG
jgi:hypothetical protein